MTMADRPLDIEALTKAREELHEVGGEGLVVESAAVVGAFSLMTKVVHSTGRKTPPGMYEKTVKNIEKTVEKNGLL